MTERHTLHRRDARKTSIEAAYTVPLGKMEALVYKTIDDFGTSGCIQDDVLEKLSNYPYSSVTARFKSLESKKLITRCNTFRKGKSGSRQEYMMSKRFFDLDEDLTEEEKQQGILGV